MFTMDTNIQERHSTTHTKNLVFKTFAAMCVFFKGKFMLFIVVQLKKGKQLQWLLLTVR